jgi:hypothetical protein
MGEQMFACESDGGPGPVLAALDKARANRVVEDVVECVLVVLFVVDDPGGEPLAEECSLAAEPGVVLPGVVALDPLHGPREVFDPGVDERVVVRAHQAVRVEPEAPPPNALREQPDERPVVVPVAEQPGFVDGIPRQVEVAVGQLTAEDSGHASTLRLVRPAISLRRTPSPLLTRLGAPSRVSDTRRGPKGYGATRRGALLGGRHSSAWGHGRGPSGPRRPCRSRGAAR